MASAGAGTLAGRRVLVTGASSGIGAATVRALVAEGARVAALARRGDRLRALAEEVAGDAEPAVVPVVGDVADLAGARTLVGQAEEALGGLDGLVSSAGIMRPGPVATGDPEDWRAMFEVNVLGLLAITQAAIPALRRAAGGANVVNISSMSGRRVPTAAGGVYAATKFAVHAIGDALRLELQADGIRVTTLSPGFVDTEIFHPLEDSPAKARYQALAEQVGMRAEDVAGAIVHVLSAPPSITTVEVAMVPTRQDDGAYARSVDD